MKTIILKMTILISMFLGANVYAGGIIDHKHNVDQHAHGNKPESSVGKPADASLATKTVGVSLLDTMRFEFDQEIEIYSGEIVRFVVTNKGGINHEFSISSEAEQKVHAKMMQKNSNMKHEDGNTIFVLPGDTKDITWLFIGDEKILLDCSIPGHFEAGMFHNMDLKKRHEHKFSTKQMTMI